MLFNRVGMHPAQYDIERQLNNGGFIVGAAKGGFSDEDLFAVSKILGTNILLPGDRR